MGQKVLLIPMAERLKAGLKLSADFLERQRSKLSPSPGHCIINLWRNVVCHELAPG